MIKTSDLQKLKKFCRNSWNTWSWKYSKRPPKRQILIVFLQICKKLTVKRFSGAWKANACDFFCSKQLLNNFGKKTFTYEQNKHTRHFFWTFVHFRDQNQQKICQNHENPDILRTLVAVRMKILIFICSFITNRL